MSNLEVIRFGKSELALAGLFLIHSLAPTVDCRMSCKKKEKGKWKSMSSRFVKEEEEEEKETKNN